MLKVIVVFLCFIMISVNVIHARNMDCTRDEAILAETEASKQNSWDSLYASFIKYSHCDTGAISEGYSASIAGILAKSWDQIRTLNKLARKDKKFEKFVISHLDETIPIGELKKIHKYATTVCPSEATKLCQQIAKATAM